MTIKELTRIRESESLIAHYAQGIDSLFRSMVFDFLRVVARPRINGLESNSQALATEAARSAGYNEALDDLLNFTERFLTIPIDRAGRRDFGGLAFAVQSGDLTEEEANAIRTGQPINYDKYTKPPIDTAK